MPPAPPPPHPGKNKNCSPNCPGAKPNCTCITLGQFREQFFHARGAVIIGLESGIDEQDCPHHLCCYSSQNVILSSNWNLKLMSKIVQIICGFVRLKTSSYLRIGIWPAWDHLGALSGHLKAILGTSWAQPTKRESESSCG